MSLRRASVATPLRSPLELTRLGGHLSACAVGRSRRIFIVPRTRPPYPPEFRRQAVELMRSGTPLGEVAVDLGVSEQTLRNLRREGDIDAGRAEGLTTDEREELRRLRRGNRRLQEEREILRKAAAFFARETD